MKLQRFGRGQQIAPLLQRLTGAERRHENIDVLHDAACIACSITNVPLDMHAGLQQVTLASCVCDPVLWRELERLQHLQHLTMP